MIAILAMGSVCAFAQKGEQAIGVSLNFGTTASNAGLGVKYQHGLTDAIRIEPSMTYYFGERGMFDITINGHYLFDVAPNLNAYPLVGIGIDFCRHAHRKTETSLKLDFGGGIEYDVTDKIAIGLELRYEVITGGFSQLVASFGAKYKF